MENSIKLFENKRVRAAWNEDAEKWYFSIVDIVGALTDSEYQQARNYWKVLKTRLKEEGNESVTKCNQLKMQSADGKYYKTDVADMEQIFRIIQSIPSKKQSLLNYGLLKFEEKELMKLTIQKLLLIEHLKPIEEKVILNLG